MFGEDGLCPDGWRERSRVRVSILKGREGRRLMLSILEEEKKRAGRRRKDQREEVNSNDPQNEGISCIGLWGK